MGLPDLAGFKSLLKNDGLFRSYFNVHLNLPVFGRRFSYSLEEDQMTCHQTIDSNIHVVRARRVLEWVYQYRLPYFWRSPLLMEFLIAKELKTDQFVFDSLDSFLQFKRFLTGSAGYLQLHFSMAVEHLKLLTSTKQKRRLAMSILQLFTRDDSRFKLSDNLYSPLMMGIYGRGNRELPPEEIELDKIVRCLKQTQLLALHELISYWLRRFLECIQCKGSVLVGTGLVGGGEEEGAECQFAEGCRAGTPHVSVQGGNEGGDVSSVKPLPPLSECAPGQQDRPLCVPTKLHHHGNHTLIAQPDQFFSGPDPKPLFPKEILSSTQPSQLEMWPEEINDYLLASLQCDSWAGGPLLEYLRVEEQGAPSSSCLLYWQAVQYLLTLDSLPEEKRENPLMNPSLHCHLVSHVTSVTALTEQHIEKSALQRVLFPPAERKKLLEYLPQGLGRSLLAASQRFAAKALLKPWKRFLVADWQGFHEYCCYQNRHSRLISPFEKKFVLPEISCSDILGKTYGYHSDALLWKAYATTMLTCCHASVMNLYHHLPSTGLKILLDTPSSEQGRRSIASAKWFFRHHIVPPTLTTLTTLTIISAHKRRCLILCKTKSKDSSHGAPDKTKLLAKPRAFQDILHDSAQLSCFHSYLQSQGEELVLPLDFWQLISELKRQLGEGQKAIRVGQPTLKVEDIHDEFFTVDADKRLQCSEPIIYELMRLPKVNLFHLLAAQGAVAHALEEKWFHKYLEHLSKNDSLDEEEENQERTFECKERTRGLWKMFTRNVIGFRRGLQNPLSLKMFQKFLMDEVNKALSSSASPKKVIGTKAINLVKLHNDLSLWMEMERYRDMADIITAAKNSGSHSPEDDFILHRKAHAIVNCFIDSPIHPRLQVNIPQESVQGILDSVALGRITRSLFHEATLYIFTALLHFWKKFCVQRFAPSLREESSDVIVVESTPVISKPKSVNGSYQDNELEKKDSHGHNPDSFPVLSFSLSHGIQATTGRASIISAIIHKPKVKILV